MAANKSPANKKWNWDLFDALYYGGMEVSELVTEVSDFEGLSEGYARRHIEMLQMPAIRREMRIKGRDWINESLVKTMEHAKSHHQKWLLHRMDKERAVIDRALLTFQTQSERLNNIKLIDDLTRRATGLDDEKPLNERERVFGLLVVMQDSMPPVLKNASTGILSESNALAESSQAAPNVPATYDAETGAFYTQEKEVKKHQSELKALSKQLDSGEPEDDEPMPFKVKQVDKVDQVKEKPALVNEEEDHADQPAEDITETLKKGGYKIAFDTGKGQAINLEGK